MIRKKTQKPAEFPADTFATFHIDTAKIAFNYLKENLRIDVDCCENWGYYENGNVSVTVSLYLKNPKTGLDELISQASATA